MHLIRFVKSLFKSIGVAFSIYSKIPMPRFDWDSDDMKYHLVFFPWVGLTIGVLQWLWMKIAMRLDVDATVFGLLSAVIIIAVTGGFHLDGYMDTCDALHSYQSRERKLEILKDPHIGAFSVICLTGLVLSYVSLSAWLYDGMYINEWMVACLGFALARSLSGTMVMNLKPAKEDGMLRSESDNSSKIVSVFLWAESIIIIIAMVVISPKAMAFSIVAVALFTLWFKNMIYRQLGGITGDMAGYYVCVAEMLMTVSVLLSGLI